MRKGFTLIELLAVVSIIVILFIITVPVISKYLDTVEEKMYQSQLDSIQSAAKGWSSKNLSVLPDDNGEFVTIYLGELKIMGLVKDNIKNPVTGELFHDDLEVLIERVNNDFTFTVLPETGNGDSDFTDATPVIILAGGSSEETEINLPYVDKGILATDRFGREIDNVNVIVKSNGVEIPEVDTSRFGTYTVHYLVDYIGGKTETVRTVEVTDTVAPVITFPETTDVFFTDVAGFDIMLGVAANDNSGEAVTIQSAGNISAIPGGYQITYTSTDSSGNIRNSIRTINVTAPEWTFQVQIPSGSLNFAFATTDSILEINWGDSTTTNFNGTGFPSKVYAVPGTYNITLKGMATRVAFCDSGAYAPCSNTTPEKLKDIVTVIPIEFGLTDASGMFKNTVITNFSEENFFTEASPNINNMYAMFRDSLNFNHPIGNWNTSNVINMSSMFNGCTKFNQPILNWNTSNVVNMTQMFMVARAYNQPLGNWDTSKVTSMSAMFYEADAFNQPLSIWNTSNVTDMSMMFYEANVFNQALGTWNTAKLTNMSLMFSSARAFNQNINVWNVSNVTNMSAMFNGALLFNQNISTWNVSKVANMNAMFSYAPVFNQNLSSWCVSLIPTVPTDFSTGATAWALAKPVWGTCP